MLFWSGSHVFHVWAHCGPLCHTSQLKPQLELVDRWGHFSLNCFAFAPFYCLCNINMNANMCSKYQHKRQKIRNFVNVRVNEEQVGWRPQSGLEVLTGVWGDPCQCVWQWGQAESSTVYPNCQAESWYRWLSDLWTVNSSFACVLLPCLLILGDSSKSFIKFIVASSYRCILFTTLCLHSRAYYSLKTNCYLFNSFSIWSSCSKWAVANSRMHWARSSET